MTPAALRYIGNIYESCIDRSFDLAQIKLHLAAQGIPRSIFQVRHDLDHVFCYAGYAASHPAPAAVSLKQIDAEMGY